MFGGDPGMTYDKTLNEMTVTGKYNVVVNSATPAVLTSPTVQATNMINGYTQISIQNKSASGSASSDLIAYPDNVSASDLT